MDITVELPIQVFILEDENAAVVANIPPPYDVTVELPVQAIDLEDYAVSLHQPERQYRSVSLGVAVIYGTSGPFKLKPQGQFLRRSTQSNQRQHVIHLGNAKADIAIVTATMQLITFTHRLEIGEFFYQTPDSLLTITNAEVVDEVLVLDTTISGGTSAIPIMPVSTQGVRALSTITRLPVPVV